MDTQKGGPSQKGTGMGSKSAIGSGWEQVIKGLFLALEEGTGIN